MARINTDLPLMIESYSMNELINVIDGYEDEEIELAWNSYGGSVWAGYQFADYLQQTNKKITARVTGIAASMGTALLAYFDKVVGSKQSDVMIHSVSTNLKALRGRKNTELYDILKTKINEAKFKDITGKELKDVLLAEGDNRVDVWLSGEQAFEVGLFSELIDLTPEEKEVKNTLVNQFKLSAELGYKLPENLKNENSNIGGVTENLNNNVNNESMNLQKLKAEHPEVYAEVRNEGITAEKQRVATWMVFNDVDPEKVKAGIISGEPMAEAEKLTLMRAAQTIDLQANLESGNAGEVTPNADATKLKTDAQKEADELNAALEEAEINAED